MGTGLKCGECSNGPTVLGSSITRSIADGSVSQSERVTVYYCKKDVSKVYTPYTKGGKERTDRGRMPARIRIWGGDKSGGLIGTVFHRSPGHLSPVRPYTLYIVSTPFGCFEIYSYSYYAHYPGCCIIFE